MRFYTTVQWLAEPLRTVPAARLSGVGATGPTGIHLVTELRKTVASVRVIARSMPSSRDCFLRRQLKNGRADVLDADATLHAIEGCDLVYDCEAALTLLPFVPPRRYLRLFNLRNCYYAGSRFLDHVDNDRFDPCPWRFHPLFFFSHSADLETLRALPRTAACLLRGLARFFGRTFARFFRLAMIIPPTLLSAALILL